MINTVISRVNSLGTTEWVINTISGKEIVTGPNNGNRWTQAVNDWVAAGNTITPA